MDKLFATTAAAIEDIPSGASIAVGGFGLCGIPTALIGAPQIWSQAGGQDQAGRGMKVAIVDSGIDQLPAYSLQNLGRNR